MLFIFSSIEFSWSLSKSKVLLLTLHCHPFQSILQLMHLSTYVCIWLGLLQRDRPVLHRAFAFESWAQGEPLWCLQRFCAPLTIFRNKMPKVQWKDKCLIFRFQTLDSGRRSVSFSGAVFYISTFRIGGFSVHWCTSLRFSGFVSLIISKRATFHKSAFKGKHELVLLLVLSSFFLASFKPGLITQWCWWS